MDWRIKQLFRWHYGAVELFGMGIFKLQVRIICGNIYACGYVCVYM